MTKIKTKFTNSYLDECQEQTLLRIERNGCWLAFWGLLVALIVQRVAYPADYDITKGEMVVLLVLAVYLTVACMREGVWDRRLRPDAKTNAVVSCIAGLVPGFVMFMQVYGNFPDKIVGCIAAGAFVTLMAGGLCFAVLSILAAAYRKRVAELEAEPDNEEYRLR
ncbi:DUF6773 family protein [Slackia heliotrinireducens]|nr:DUF6773 family protein [Slackia heliotrinireducens]